MKLELGSGDRPYEDGTDWFHNDERQLPDIEIVHPAETISEVVEHDSISVLRAAHLLEHFSWKDTEKVLGDWYSVIKPGGTIWIEVPNLTWQAREIVDPKGSHGSYTEQEMVEFIYGSQDYPGNYHKAAFTSGLLRNKLESTGFLDVQVDDIGQVLVAYGKKP